MSDNFPLILLFGPESNSKVFLTLFDFKPLTFNVIQLVIATYIYDFFLALC